MQPRCPSVPLAGRASLARYSFSVRFWVAVGASKRSGPVQGLKVDAQVGLFRFFRVFSQYDADSLLLTCAPDVDRDPIARLVSPDHLWQGVEGVNGRLINGGDQVAGPEASTPLMPGSISSRGGSPQGGASGGQDGSCCQRWGIRSRKRGQGCNRLPPNRSTAASAWRRPTTAPAMPPARAPMTQLRSTAAATTRMRIVVRVRFSASISATCCWGGLWPPLYHSQGKIAHSAPGHGALLPSQNRQACPRVSDVLRWEKGAGAWQIHSVAMNLPDMSGRISLFGLGARLWYNAGPVQAVSHQQEYRFREESHVIRPPYRPLAA